MPSKRRIIAALLLLALPAASVVAQGGRSVRAARHAGAAYAELTDLARAAGAVATAVDGVLTFRGALGVVTFFAGSTAGLMQRPTGGGPLDVSFSAPVVQYGAEWWAPLDALEYLGVEPSASGAALWLANGSEVALANEAFPGAPPPALAASADAAWEVTELGAGVTALRFYDGAVALTLLDLALLPLARPELTTAVDAALDAAWLSGAASDNVLLLQLVAAEATTWEATLRFSQGSRELEVRYPYRLLLQEGTADSVAPDSPVAGVILLPAGFDLYSPLGVEWGGVSAQVSFRR